MSLDRAYWDGLARDWARESRQRLWRTHADRVARDLFDRWLPSGRVQRVLKTDLFDEAFGDGLGDLLQTRGTRVVGTDLSPEVGRLALGRQPGWGAVGADARRLPFRPGTFDVVISPSTLDHFEQKADITRSFKEIHRVLRPGGELLLTLDNPANPVVALRQRLPFGALHRLGLLPYRVGATLGPQEAPRTLVACGFEVLEVRATLHCPRAPAVAMASGLGRWTPEGVQAAFLGFLLAFERLADTPTRFRTGYFVAIRAVRP